MRRVVITGCGTLNPLGNNVAETWDAMSNGKDGIRKLDIPYKERLSVKIGGQVNCCPVICDLVDEYHSMLDRSTVLAIAASDEAVRSSGINFNKALEKSSAIILGTAGGGLITQDENFRKVYEEKRNRVHPFTVPKLMHNAAASQISIRNNIIGPTFTVSTACASSNHAIGQAVSMIRSGQVKSAIAGGYDSMLCLGGIKAWEGLRIMSSDKCRPFCATRDGMVQGEGATIFVLEEMQQALTRDANIYAEISGFSMSSDASDIMNPSPEGLSRAIKLAIDDAGFSPADVDYINAHGTGTTTNDRVESFAINKIFGKENKNLFVSSTKSMHGHLIGGSGAIELLSCILAIKKGILAPTINFNEDDPFCNLNLVKNNSIEKQVHKVISNSFAFGGLNAVLALKSFSQK